MKGADLERMMTREQKQEICKAAIIRVSEGRLDGHEFSVDYDRRFGSLFSATLHKTDDNDERFVKVIFSTRLPVGNNSERFETVAEEAAQAVIDIREKSIEAVTAHKAVHPVVTCPCCDARVMIMLKGES